MVCGCEVMQQQKVMTTQLIISVVLENSGERVKGFQTQVNDEWRILTLLVIDTENFLHLLQRLLITFNKELGSQRTPQTRVHQSLHKEEEEEE